MRIDTVKTNVYKFDELSEDSKQNAIEKLYDINVDFDNWSYDDGYLELSEKEMKVRKIKLSKKWYEWKDKNGKSGNIPGEYPAYSGLFKWNNMYFDIDRGGYIQFGGLEVTDFEIFRRFLKIPKKLWENCNWYFIAIPGREISTNFEIEPDFYNGNDFTKKQQVIIDNAIEIMNDKISEALSMLKANYDYLTSREAIIETIEANEYDFTIDGKLY